MGFHDALGRALGFAIGQSEAELRPDRSDARVEPDPDADVERLAAVAGQFLDEAELVPVVDMQQRTFIDGAPQDCARFVWAVEDDIGAGEPQVARLLILEVRHDFGNPAFLTQNLADALQVIGLERPGKAGLRIASTKRLARMAGLAAQRVFGEHEER